MGGGEARVDEENTWEAAAGDQERGRDTGAAPVVAEKQKRAGPDDVFEVDMS